MTNASSVERNSPRTSTTTIRTTLWSTIAAALMVGLVPPACGSVRGTGKPLLEKGREEGVTASASAPAAGGASARNPVQTSTASKPAP
ncbi:MAG: hypothetical protein LW806_11845 [Planctomycetaceae bacterium]|nr:hypothetical protein [Planctomycetaceae bacterium]